MTNFWQINNKNGKCFEASAVVGLVAAEARLCSTLTTRVLIIFVMVIL